MTEQTLFETDSVPAVINAAKPPKQKPVNLGSLVRAAESIRTRITFCRQDRREDTRKRRQEAEQFRREADHLERKATAIENLVAAHEAGTVHALLAGIRNRQQVERLLSWEKLPAPTGPEDWKLAELEAFKKLGLDDEAKFAEARAALLELAQVEVSPAEALARRLKEARSEVASYKIEGFFRTQREVAELIVEEAGLRTSYLGAEGEGLTILEPSAGDGAIAEVVDEMRMAASTLHVCEQNHRLTDILTMMGFEYVGSDFLQVTRKYDRIIGNPPFERLQDIEHVRHGYELLNDGGRLMRHHVVTVSKGVVINAEAQDSLEAAERLRAQRTEELRSDNASLADRYGDDCRLSVCDLDDSDQIPQLFQYDYVYRVEPCTLSAEQCVACIEGAL